MNGPLLFAAYLGFFGLQALSTDSSNADCLQGKDAGSKSCSRPLAKDHLLLQSQKEMYIAEKKSAAKKTIDCCGSCPDTPYCSGESGNCYLSKAKPYYTLCNEALIPRAQGPAGPLPVGTTDEMGIKFMSYNLRGWDSFNKNTWKGKNVLGKVEYWQPDLLGAQEVEKGGFGYEEVADIVKEGTGLTHAGGSQFFNDRVLEKKDSAWVNLIGGYWMSMTTYLHKSSGATILFFDSHWKHHYGMEQAKKIADAVYQERQKHGNPPTILVGDTNQFCHGHNKDAIRYLKGEFTIHGRSPVSFHDVHDHDHGKSFTDEWNPACRIDFMFASKGQWKLVHSEIDRQGMGASGEASDHAALVGVLVPIV